VNTDEFIAADTSCYYKNLIECFDFFESAGMIPVELEERQEVIECCETLALGEVSRIIESLGFPLVLRRFFHL
ncbi:MAG: hypothetical protein PXY39_00680, partial [archaeon]|nr:hypothetical protein [archaeon]